MAKRLILGALMGAAALPAAAQPVGLDPAAERAAGAVYSATRCIVRTNRPVAVRLLEELPTDGAPADAILIGLARQSGCRGEALTAERATLIRGGLAQALFLHDFEGFGLDPRNPLALVELRLPLEDGSSPEASLYRWADCVVRSDPGNTERLLRLPAGSRQEAQVITRLRGKLSGCADEGTRFVVGSAVLRSLIAQAAYSLMQRHWAE